MATSGRAGHPGPPALYDTPLGLARDDGPVPISRTEPATQTAPPDTGSDHGHLLRLWLIRFSEHKIIFVGDGTYGTHEFARFCRHHGRRLSLVSKLHPGANLVEPPPVHSGKGRPRVKGPKIPSPEQAAAGARLRCLKVDWYGGGSQVVQTATGTGQWYKSGRGLVPVRWVYVRDLEGTHRDEYFFSTDLGLGVGAIIGLYTGRWNIETTFEECRAHLGLARLEGTAARR